MAPTASDPKDLKLILNPARRKALVSLTRDIVQHMRSQIEQSFNVSPNNDTPLFADTSTRDSSRSPTPSDPEEEARQRRLEARLEKTLSTPKLQELKKHALLYFDHWSNEVRVALRKNCEGPEDPRSEQRRKEWNAARNPPPPPYSPDSDTKDVAAEVEAEAREIAEAKDVSLLQSLYHPIPTRLTTISKEDRICTISCMVLLLLSLGHYSAHSRVLLCYLTSSFAIPNSVLTKEETEIAQTLLLASKALSADAETKKRQAENAISRRWKVGLASVAGAAVIGITGGLATPIVAGAIGGIMGGVGLGGVASFLGIFAMNGALVGSLFGAFGGKMTGEMVDAYAKEVSDFKFLPVATEWGEFATNEEALTEGRRLRVTIGINGWLNGKDDVIKPWRVLGRETEVFGLRYEMDALIALGTSLENMVSSYAWSFVKIEILKRTVLATLWSALWPVYLLKMATSIDNPFAVARNRSEKAGEVLADALINKAQGERPVTLVGYSLGARVIYSCLKSLAERKAFGLIENVVFIGAPVPSNSNNWRVMRSVVSGRIINVYSENDYILAFLYRATSIQFGVAGLQEIGDVEGIDNLNLSKEVSGHLKYPEIIGQILKRSGFEGVLVENTTIEDDSVEIQLLDAEEKVDEKKVSHQMDLLGLMDDPIVPGRVELDDSTSRHGNSGIEELTSGIASMGMSQPNLTFSPPQPIRPTLPPQPFSDPGPANINSDILSLTHSLSSTHISEPPQYSFSVPQQPQNEVGYESSDDGGIVMVDNDSEEEDEEGMRHLPGVPIPDDDFPSEPQQQVVEPRDSGKAVMRDEQKVLGSFPRDRVGSPASTAGGREMERSSPVQGQRRSAKDMGLY